MQLQLSEQRPTCLLDVEAVEVFYEPLQDASRCLETSNAQDFCAVRDGSFSEEKRVPKVSLRLSEKLQEARTTVAFLRAPRGLCGLRAGPTSLSGGTDVGCSQGPPNRLGPRSLCQERAMEVQQAVQGLSAFPPGARFFFLLQRPLRSRQLELMLRCMCRRHAGPCDSTCRFSQPRLQAKVIYAEVEKEFAAVTLQPREKAAPIRSDHPPRFRRLSCRPDALLEVVEVPVMLREERLVEVPKVHRVPVAVPPASGLLTPSCTSEPELLCLLCAKVTQHLRPAVEAAFMSRRTPYLNPALSVR